MRIEPFVMERWQSLNEHDVEINLSDSGVHPLSLREFLDDPDFIAEVFDQRLVYTHSNGTPELRRRIAALYAHGPGATPENVEVVNGGAEANLITIWSLVEPGDEVVVMVPNYGQIRGLARGFGAQVKEWWLRPDFEQRRWVADLDELEALVTERTKLIAICTPNNPTGRRLSAAELDGICRIAERHGAWILSDEIYIGSDLDGETTPTIWGRYDRTVVTNSLSKAYGLPGLRLGWIVAPAETAADFWMHHDYTTISPGALSDLVATRALHPEHRERLLARTRAHLGSTYARIAAWLDRHAESLRYIPPDAGAMLYLHYDHPIGSLELVERLRVEKSVLVVPGDHYDMDGWLRIGFGGEAEELEAGLQRVHELLDTLAAS